MTFKAILAAATISVAAPATAATMQHDVEAETAAITGSGHVTAFNFGVGDLGQRVLDTWSPGAQSLFAWDSV